MITSKSGLLGHAMTIQPSTESKSCPHCGKTDFDDSTGCLAPSVLSPAAGDWVCTDANYSGPFAAGDDGDNPVCQYCGESYSHTEDCLYAYARSRKGSSK